jgi:hypothetical protein
MAYQPQPVLHAVLDEEENDSYQEHVLADDANALPEGHEAREPLLARCPSARGHNHTDEPQEEAAQEYSALAMSSL